MQRHITDLRGSDDEAAKEGGLLPDFDEIARRGKITPDESKIAKTYGIYSARQADTFMARVSVPGGVLTASQVRGLSQISETYAQSQVCVTTRQAVQLHYLRLGDLAPTIRDLARYRLTTFHGCGDNIRNVAACPRASLCPHRRFDVLPDARQTAEFLNACRDLDDLPRKYKISFSGCQAGCAQPRINCVGAVAIERKRADGGQETGYRVTIGGGMGWRPQVGELLYGFVPRDRIHLLCRAVGQLFRDHGDRFHRRMARLKVVVERLGIDACRRIVEAFMDSEGVDHGGFEKEFIEDCGPAVPPRPLTAARPQSDDGKAIAQIMVPKGEVDSASLKRVAELSERYGDQSVYTTNRQNLEIHGVDPKKLAELEAEIAKLPVAGGRFFGLDDIVPCTGTTCCPMAVSETRRMYDVLQGVVEQEKYDAIRDAAILNITGCPNSCSPYYIADIGLRGMRIREDQGSVEGYQIRLGGTQERLGQVFGEFKTEDCPRVVEAVLDTFLACRQGKETLADSVWRGGEGNPAGGMETYRKAVEALGIRYETMVRDIPVRKADVVDGPIE